MLGRLVASAGHCRCELPGDAGVLERIGGSGNALESLVVAGAVPC